MASKGVSAMAISGLWLSSPYACGLAALSFSASDLSGCAWMDSALPADSTFSMKGNCPPAASSKLWSFGSVAGPFGCVPIQSSA